MKNYAIIGSNGFIAPRHFQAIKDTGGTVRLLCDIISPADFHDYREMLASKEMDDVDAVVICTPNHWHPEMVRASLFAGKKVLCEKPLTTDTDFHMLDGANVVLQLRYHPLFKKICDKMKKATEINVVLKAYRDENFWNSWKGDERQSGGVVYIMGSHIFDLVVQALGTDYKIEWVHDSMKKSISIIKFGDITVNFDLEFLDDREGQTRHIEVDGEKFVLSLKDNLSFEGLHDKVYEAFKQGKAPTLADAIPSIRLIDEIKKFPEQQLI